MKKMRIGKVLNTVITVSFVIVSFWGCVKEDNSDEDGIKRYCSFVGSIAEIVETKTYIEDGKKVMWQNGDIIGVCSDIQSTCAYYNYKKEGSLFSGYKAVEGNTFYAVYPVISEHLSSGLDLKAFPVHLDGSSYGETRMENMSMVAKSEDNTLCFKQIGGLIHIILRSRQIINKITLRGNRSELIVGRGVVDITSDNPCFAIDRNSDLVHVENSVYPDESYSGDINKEQHYYFTVPPMTFEDGITIQIDYKDLETGENKSLYKSTDKTIKVSRAVVKKFSEINLDDLSQEHLQEIESDRDALIALYNTMGGAYWQNKTNWCSSRPLNEWAGVRLDNEGRVSQLFLSGMGLSGGIPSEIRHLKHLRWLDLSSNAITSLPEEICDLGRLETLSLSSNRLTELPSRIGEMKSLTSIDLGSNYFVELPLVLCSCPRLKSIDFKYNHSFSGILPEELANMESLQYLILDGLEFPNNTFPVILKDLTHLKCLDMNGCQLEGAIPEWLGNLRDLNFLSIRMNKLSGTIPHSFGNLTNLTHLDLRVNELSGSLPDEMANLTKLEVLYGSYNNLSGNTPEWLADMPNLRSVWLVDNDFIGPLSEKMKDLKYLEEISFGGSYLGPDFPIWLAEMPTLKTIVLWGCGFEGELPASLGSLSNLGILSLSSNNFDGTVPEEWLGMINLKELYIDDNMLSGIIPSSISLSSWWNNLAVEYEKQKEGYGLILESLYESSDYSEDGRIITIQEHSKGNGIPLVFVGDAFSDRMISDGSYEKWMRSLSADFFDIEPLQSFKEYFDIYTVVAVSKNETIGKDTAFDVTINDYFYDYSSDRVTEYVKKIDCFEGKTDNVTVVLFIPDKVNRRLKADLFSSNGYAIAQISIYDDWNRKKILQHEACGHAFGKLGDEYGNSNTESVFNEDLHEQLDERHERGVFLNLDWRSDLEQIVWKDFINNPDYSHEELGAYAGGWGYSKGIYHPTESSTYCMMRKNQGEFNAPSRWVIYKRIKTLAGEDYSFDEFLEYDRINTHVMTSAHEARNNTISPEVSCAYYYNRVLPVIDE